MRLILTAALLLAAVPAAAPALAAPGTALNTPKPGITYVPGAPMGNVSVYHVVPQAAPSAPVPGPGTQPAAGPAAQPAGGDDDPAAELMRLREEQQKAWATINANNPMSADYGSLPGGATAGTGPFEQINKILSQPVIQAYLRFFNNPAFSKAAEQVAGSPNRMMLLYAELGWIMFMLIFRAWRFSRSSHWAAKLWTRVWTFAMFWGGAAIAVPWAVLGDPYYQTLNGLVIVALSYIKK